MWFPWRPSDHSVTTVSWLIKALLWNSMRFFILIAPVPPAWRRVAIRASGPVLRRRKADTVINVLLNEDSHAALSRPQLQTPAALGKPALTQQQYQSRLRIWISELVWLVRMLQWYVMTNLTKTKGFKEESLCVLLAHPPRHQNGTSWRAAWYYCCNDVVLM